MKKIKLITSGLTLAPLLAFASGPDLHAVISTVAGYLDQILKLIMGLAVVFFVYYVVQYYIRPNDKRAEAAQYVMWSLIGFFVILTFWGIVNIFTSSFGFGLNTQQSWTNFSNIFPR